MRKGRDIYREEKLGHMIWRLNPNTKKQTFVMHLPNAFKAALVLPFARQRQD